MKLTYINGELFLFQGGEYPLDITLDEATVRANLIFDTRFQITTPRSPLAFDYVVVHEMYHLIHMNHSKAFWQLVEEIFPNYHQGKAWLKENTHKLNAY